MALDEFEEVEQGDLEKFEIFEEAKVEERCAKRQGAKLTQAENALNCSRITDFLLFFKLLF